jgi:hypothetical protein
MFERYTEKARRVIFFARYEASQWGSRYIESEHLLLGILREDKQLAKRLGLPDSASARELMERDLTHAPVTATSVDLPLSHECKRILAFGAEAANRLGHSYIGTGHLLLGVLKAEKSYAARFLKAAEMTSEKIEQSLDEAEIPDRSGTFLPHWRKFVLTAPNPKLTPAGTSNPPEVHHGPGSTGIEGRQVICRNMSMAEFAGRLPEIAPGYIAQGKVIDETGLQGTWDFTLNFSPAGFSRRPGRVSLFQAIEEQLGLKLDPIGNPGRSRSALTVTEVFTRAQWFAAKAEASEIGIDLMMLALDPDIEFRQSPPLIQAIPLSAEVKPLVSSLQTLGPHATDFLRDVLREIRRKKQGN